jgi:hypothetical integral membrane protein (TIGR02206 family)
VPAPDPWTHFAPFSPTHAAAVAASATLMAALVIAGLRRRGAAREERFRRTWGWSILLFQLAAGVWWLFPANFTPDRSIPLNMCRLVAFIAAAAMLTPWRWPQALLYFWGLALCPQALITPVFPEGPAYPVFWIFWIGHTQIVGSALYDLIVLRYRPSTRDFALTCLASLAYALIVIPLDAAYTLNYGGLGPVLFDAPNLARRLGPWPWRPIWIILIGYAWMTLFWVIWLAPERRRRRATPPPATLRPSTAQPP